MNEYLACWSKYATFSGRSRRREFWMFALFNFLATIVAQVIDGIIGTGCIVYLVYSLAVLIPGWAVFIRRMHDTGRSGWWWLIGLVPLIGIILLLVWLCQDSQAGENKYGANPKAAA